MDDKYREAWDITPSDSADLRTETDAIYVLGAGVVRVTMAVGNATLDWTLPANTGLRVGVRRVHATGTTATGIKGLKR